MVDLFQEVRPGSGRFISGENVLADLPEYLAPFKSPVILSGEKSLDAFHEFYGQKLPYEIFTYARKASREDAKRLVQEIGEGADAIVAIGGGMLLDTAKMVANRLGVELVMIPTIVSNCAPYTPLAVVYSHEGHQFLDTEFMLKTPYMTLVDWKFMLRTPLEFFIAGIGDTFAKWYELEAIVRHLDIKNLKAAQRLGIVAAREILSILEEDSESAIASLKDGVITGEFSRVVDTIIAIAGTVGGFGERYGRVSGAHALHNALSLIESTHEVLHGAKVAYGILVQLAYTGDWEEIKKLRPLYKRLDLPRNLADIKVTGEGMKKLPKVAEFAASKEETYILLDAGIQAEKVLDAIHNLEKVV
ncbi:MAG: iron-containing alcohol dehydrogenase family protein [Turicibacter sp.]|nr:iron-containing alcohol dehydrogenase family protein [Turicibacter sp.]